MMSLRTIGLVVVVLAGAAAAVLWIRHSERNPTPVAELSEPTHSVNAPTNSDAFSGGSAAASARVGGSPAQDLSDSALTKALAAATEHRAFARSLLEPAKAGHHGAQYFLFEALRFCDSGYRFYFDRPGKRRTLDEALQWASTRPALRIEDVYDVYARCRALKEEDASEFGTASAWLEKATAGGHAIARVTTGQQLLLKARLAAYAASSRTGTAGDGDVGSSKPIDEALQLFRQALESKEPAVLWKFGESQGFFEDDPKQAMKAQFAWFLVACQRGYDCGESSSWYRSACHADGRHLCRPGEDVITFIKRETQNDFLEIEQLATQINVRLDNGSFEEFGLPAKAEPVG